MFSRWSSACHSVRPSVRSMYVRPSALRFRSITSVFINGFHSNFAYAFAQQFLAWDCQWANFNNLSQSYGTCQGTKNGFWPLVSLLVGVS